MENKNLKPFNLESAKAGKAVITRDGRDVKIIDFEFCETPAKQGIIAKVRKSRGQDIDAACGQLANKNEVAQLQPTEIKNNHTEQL